MPCSRTSCAMVRSLEEPEPALVASFTSPLVARLFLWLRAVLPCSGLAGLFVESECLCADIPPLPALMSPARSLGHKRTQRTPTMRHTRIELSHFVFPDCESSPRCATDLVFYRCMRMSPLAPPAGGAFFYARCATGAASGFRHRNQRKRVGV